MAMSSAGHFYGRDGSPRHTVIGKNGVERPTTIRDARPLFLLPSTTTVQKIEAKPQLDKWKINQGIIASWGITRNPGESDEDLLTRTFEAAFKQVDDAADIGTRIHAALEAFFGDQEYDQTLDVYVQAVARLFDTEKIHVMQRELTVVNISEGYAGRADLLIDSPQGTGVGDYKARKTKPGKPASPYDGQSTQIAAYVMAHFGEIGNHVGFNLFLSTTEPGRVDISWYSPKELAEEWKAFRALNTLWQIRNHYHPGQH